MNMKQFRYALVLATERSFSRAAEALGISQPSLSQYLKKIEKEVNAQLFDRSGNEVRLTDAGRAYIDAGRRILDIERQMQGRINDINDSLAGSIIVGISPHRAVCLMPEVIARFSRQYPGIQMVLEEHTGRELMDGAERGEFDLFLTADPMEEKLFEAVKVMDEEVVVAVPGGMALESEPMAGRKYPAIDVKLLDGATMITLSETQLMQRMLVRLCETYGLRYQTAVTCTSIEAQLAMVKAGLGWALVPSEIDKFNEAGIRYYSIRQALPRREIVAAYRRQQYVSRAMRRLIEILIQVGQSSPNA